MRGAVDVHCAAAAGSGRQHNQPPPHLSYPIEQGVVCTLKESFGFVHCADRPEQVFFHYSQLIGCNVHDLHCDQTQVEFRIGPSQKDANKLAAYQVKPLPEGVTIEWERVEYGGQRVRGLVERRAPRSGSSRSSGLETTATSAAEGTIRLLHETPKEKGAEDDDDEAAVTTTADGPLVRYTLDDYQIDTTANSNNNRRGGSSSSLSRGDLVECRVVTEKRTGYMYAREVTLLVSERERAQRAQEQRLLATAKEEHGVVTSFKGEYGFLKSSSRREQIFFHYDSIHLIPDDDDGGGGDGKDSSGGSGGDEGRMVLKEGQDMKFLVIEEEEDEHGRPRARRISARRVSLQPRGSVKFFDVICRGAVGTVLQCPQCHDAAHALDQHGRIRLRTPIHGVTTNFDLEEPEPGEPTEKTVTEVYLSTEDSPGGKFSFHGGQYVGLWIQVGDTLLFDIVQDYSDGACRAVPTAFLTPPPEPIRGQDMPADDDTADVVPSVRIVDLTLAGRAEGVVSALKDIYGFIQFAERPVDVHFKMYQMLPEALQEDLRRNMGIANVDAKGRPLRLELGAEVHFDLSVHGTIHSNSQKQRRLQKDNERENLKAQRILLLPPKTIAQIVTIATDVKGTVSKQDTMQPYVGNIEFDPPLKPLTMEQRHPMVAKMLSTFLAAIEAAAPGEDVPPVMFHDVHSAKEDDVVIQMVESMGHGKLTYTHIPQEDAPSYPGRLCIQKATEDPAAAAADDATDAKGNNGGEEESDKKKEDTAEVAPTPTIGQQPAGGEDTKPDSLEAGESKASSKSAKTVTPKKKSNKQKPVKSVRYDKHSFSKDLLDEAPPGVDDVVECNVVQDRRTGQSHIENMRIVERHVAEYSMSETSSVGIVKEVVPARNFGFISVIDDTAASTEMLFFQLKTAAAPTDGNGEPSSPPEKKAASLRYRKGDAVKFDIGTEKNGKRVALNVTVLPKDALPGKADKNACRGLVLQQPSVTSLNKAAVRKTSSNISNVSSGDKASRWDSVEEDRKKPAETGEPVTELGCILLTEDPSSMFRSSNSHVSDENAEAAEETAEAGQLKSHLRYKNGAIAIHGVGSASAGDEKTNPRRGDLVSFVKGGSGVRDVRIVSRGTATLLRGRLENIQIENEGIDGAPVAGTAKFISDEDKTYDVSLSEVVSCAPSVLKEKEAAEGILYEDCIFGIARTVDLYLDTKLGVGHKERPKLNLTVKKDRGGKIMAQSAMAKGPDGTTGFAPGWTTRVSKFASLKETATELSIEAEPFVPPGTQSKEPVSND